MKRQFKSHKKKHYGFRMWIIIIIISLFLNYYIINNVSNSYLINYDLSKLKFNLDKNKILLKLGLNFSNSIEHEKEVFKEYEYLNKSIYLYNTHQTEEYADGTLIDADKYIKELLEKNNITVKIEDTDIMGYIKKNNLPYKDSYKVSRSLLETHLNDNDSLYIDLHRDSASKKATTATINDKKYAKIMFVIGGNFDGFEKNYKVCEDLNNILKNFDENLSRGIFIRKTSAYNQDLASNVILIELGGQNNTMEEVKNTIDILSDVLLYYIGE